MRHHIGKARAVRHIHCFEGLRKGADLIDFDQHRIGAALGNAAGQTLGVGDKKIIPDQLHFIAELAGEHGPAFPVIFAHAIFDRQDRVIAAKVGQISHVLFRA